MEKNVKAIVFILLGFILGYNLNDFLHGNEIPKVITKTKIETDTVFVELRDTVIITQKEIVHQVLRDTVLISPIQHKIKLFTVSKPFLYGNVSVKGEVLGEVLKMDIRNDFKLPTITNTIKHTETIIKKPSGIFLTAGVNRNFSTPIPYIGGIFIKDKYLLGLNTSGIQFGYKVSQ